jgi:16S rRNA (uracil1498-N3)-methyltransferase
VGEPRVLVPPGTLVRGSRLELDPAEARHVVTVLRRRPGDVLEALDGAGRTADLRVDEVRRHRVRVTVESVRQVPPPAGASVHLALGVLHTSAMDWAVQKATELGVRTLTPLLAARCQAGGRTVIRRADHWRRTGEQALKQCGRPWALEVVPPRTLDELLEAPPPGPVVAGADGTPVREISLPTTDVTLVVGPEGGFDDVELDALRATGWPTIALGPHTLRAETAAVAGIAVLGQLLLSHGSRGAPVTEPTV